MKVTIKLSGHILFPTLGAMPDLKKYVAVIKEIKSLGHDPFVVVGGGEPARTTSGWQGSRGLMNRHAIRSG